MRGDVKEYCYGIKDIILRAVDWYLYSKHILKLRSVPNGFKKIADKCFNLCFELVHGVL